MAVVFAEIGLVEQRVGNAQTGLTVALGCRGVAAAFEHGGEPQQTLSGNRRR